ncbi:GNAT family N-acetyltransferase [Yoonia sp.]|uniref:GNAT family N-acetyltransferase n=1 Tax=Yoonia sp. TaxID=2212373 RepID=UPI0023B5B364
MKITTPIPPAHLAAAADLYWQAFGTKLGTVLGPREKGLRFIESVQRPDHALCAIDDGGQLLGVVGFKTIEGALVGGRFRDLTRVYGVMGAAWRALLLAALERDTENDRFLMDGLFVAPQSRGKGIGTALLDAICQEAHQRGYSQVRLDVIDTNARAKALYLAVGFKPLKTTRIGLLRLIFGFRSSTTMVRDVA